MDTATLSVLFVLLALQLAVAGFSLYLAWDLHQRKTPVSTGFESQVLDKLAQLSPPPPPKPAIPPEVAEAIISQAVTDGVFMAEQYAKQLKKANPKEPVPSADKHHEAMKHAKQRLTTAGIELPEMELARRIAATHATLKGTRRL